MSEEKRNPSDEIIEETEDLVEETTSMELDEEIEIVSDEKPKTDNNEKPKHQWQILKESWYDKVPLTVKQLDIIIGLGIAGMIILAIVIALDASGVF